MSNVYSTRIHDAVRKSANPMTQQVFDSIVDNIDFYSSRRRLFYREGGGTYGAGIVMGQCAILCQLLNDEGGDFNGPNTCRALVEEYASRAIIC